jgi:hypothetical protein
MPLVKNIHQDVVLTNISLALSNDKALVAPQIWPVVPVKKDSDIFYVYDKSNLRVEETRWAPKTSAKEINWNVTHEGYKTERHALAELVEDDEKANQDSPIDVMADSASIIAEKLMIRREKRLAAVLLASGTYGAGADVNIAVAERWDNYTSATSDPSVDVASARAKINSMTGKSPNVMVLPRMVYEKAREHPKVLERIKYTQIGVITPDLLATLWDIPKIIVAGGIENTALEGQSDVLSYIWGKQIFFGYVAPRPGLKQLSWGYHIQSQAMLTDRWRDEERKGDVIRTSYKDVPKLVSQGAGYIARTVIS